MKSGKALGCLKPHLSSPRQAGLHSGVIIMTQEGSVVKACLEYLTYYGAFVWRNNTGGLRDAKNRMVFFGKPGSSDIIGVLPGGRFIACECKTAKGKLSEKQKEFLARVEEFGGLAIVARSVDDVIQGLKKPVMREAQCVN